MNYNDTPAKIPYTLAMAFCWNVLYACLLLLRISEALIGREAPKFWTKCRLPYYSFGAYNPSKLASVNPFQLISNMLSKKERKFDSKAPSWDQLVEIMHSNEVGDQLVKDTTRGHTNSRATLRLFDSPNNTTPRITLFRDSASWCPYCQLIWLQLEEKRLPYNTEYINMRCYGSKPASFMAINPSGGIPVIKIDGFVVKESKVIMQLLENTFPNNNPLNFYRDSDAEPLFRLERALFSSWLRWLTSGKSHDVEMRRKFISLMDTVDEALGNSGGPYFMGFQFSLVDIAFVPFLERMAASLPYYKGLIIRGTDRWPSLQKWFEAMESRPTYSRMRNDYYSHVHNLPPQVGECITVLPEKHLEKYALEIDGKSTGAWKLPLNCANELECPPWWNNLDCDESKKDAAIAILRNREAVVRFACRGDGLKGFPPVDAPLADPNAVPNENMFPLVDVALRHVVHALLSAPENVSEAEVLDRSATESVVKCLRYLRDRVGVPRDMSFPAARQLRAHLNWYIDKLYLAQN